ncbi:MAG: hypothetical protein VB858_01490 [Planctomycetaceae bacterium]
MDVTNSRTEPEELEISCGACGVTLHVESHLRTTQCPFCASPSVIERPPSVSRPDPTFVVGFVIDQARAAQIVQRWIRSRSLFARSDFKQAAATLTRGVYLPAWLYGAIARTSYSAQIGENYQETQTYTTRDSKGNTVTRTRTVTKTEWRSLQGQHSCYVLDVIVTASGGVSNAALEAIEPFDLRALRRYSPSLISGWLAEDPSRSKAECLQLAHNESVENISAMLNDFMPGDRHRDLNYQSSLDEEVIDLVLLPVWSFAVKYHPEKDAVRILVNGQTGRVHGRVPTSAIKVTVAVILGIGMAAGLFALFSSAH